MSVLPDEVIEGMRDHLKSCDGCPACDQYIEMLDDLESLKGGRKS